MVGQFPGNVTRPEKCKRSRRQRATDLRRPFRTDHTPVDTHRFIRLWFASGGMAMAGRPKQSPDAARSRTRPVAGRKPLTGL